MDRSLALLAVFADYLSVSLSTVPEGKKRRVGGGGSFIGKLRIHFSVF